jgi:hypothetical protein
MEISGNRICRRHCLAEVGTTPSDRLPSPYKVPHFLFSTHRTFPHLHTSLRFLTMRISFAISTLVLILAPIAADGRLFDATKRLRVEAKDDERVIRGRMTMDGQRILDADLDLSMSMQGSCATLNRKLCRKDGTCMWDGAACTEGTSFPTYGPTTASIATAEMTMSMPTYSPTGPYPTYSPTELSAEKMPPTLSTAACALHLMRKPCVKDSTCSWDGSACSALPME